jgi:hypothetical protein
MNDPLTVYFTGEKQAGALCLALGVVALAFSIWVWRSHAPFRAMAVPVVLISLVQLGIGGTLVARTERQVGTLKADLAREPAAARAQELTRMDRVNASFTAFKILEAVLIAAALGMALAFRGRPAVTAVGLGILVQAAVMLAFDVFAEHRAHVYTAWLRGG